MRISALTGPVTQSAVLGQAVTAVAFPWEDHVSMSGVYFDGVDYLDEIHTVSFD